MGSILKSTQNTRSILKDSLRYIRSDELLNLDERDIQWLAENNVLTVVDLRTTKEAEKKPCCLKGRAEFTYLNIPVSFGEELPETPEKVPLYYLKIVDDTMREIISTIENSKTNVIYFCRQGKDRSSVVSALLLLRQGISQELIISDYMLSAENLKEGLAPDPKYMAKFLREIEVPIQIERE